jgi:hypothetical protein
LSSFAISITPIANWSLAATIAFFLDAARRFPDSGRKFGSVAAQNVKVP